MDLDLDMKRFYTDEEISLIHDKWISDLRKTKEDLKKENKREVEIALQNPDKYEIIRTYTHKTRVYEDGRKIEWEEPVDEIVMPKKNKNYILPKYKIIKILTQEEYWDLFFNNYKENYKC